jgi:hypothetical protein
VKFKYCFAPLVLIIVFQASCKKNASPKPQSNVDVYVAGSINNAAAYWKNGAPVSLPAPGSLRSTAKAIAVSGNDVYITGAIINNVGTDEAAIWKNGTVTLLTDGVLIGDARAIALNANDVYVAGYTSDSKNRHFATYWKNGVKIVIGDPQSNSEASAIAINGSDIYVAGFVFEYDSPNSGNQWAAIWKNGVLTKLISNNSFNAKAIAFNGNDIYVTGNIVYWKNGVETKLSSALGDVNLSSIAVAGGDVFLGGTIINGSGSIWTYWKNGVPSMPGSPSGIEVGGIAVTDQDIYLAGVMDLAATVWKNGTPVKLGQNSNATCIALVSK